MFDFICQFFFSDRRKMLYPYDIDHHENCLFNSTTISNKLIK